VSKLDKLEKICGDLGYRVVRYRDEALYISTEGIGLLIREYSESKYYVLMLRQNKQISLVLPEEKLEYLLRSFAPLEKRERRGENNACVFGSR